MSKLGAARIAVHNGAPGATVGIDAYLNRFDLTKHGLLVVPRLTADGSVYVSPKTGVMQTRVVYPHNPRAAVQLKRNAKRIHGTKNGIQAEIKGIGEWNIEYIDTYAFCQSSTHGRGIDVDVCDHHIVMTVTSVESEDAYALID